MYHKIYLNLLRTKKNQLRFWIRFVEIKGEREKKKKKKSSHRYSKNCHHCQVNSLTGQGQPAKCSRKLKTLY